MRLMFESFDITEYGLFLAAKRVPEYTVMCDRDSGLSCGLEFDDRFAHLAGVEAGPVVRRSWMPLPRFLFDDQRAVTQMALEAERFAVWMDCGLGKTPIEIEWARQVAEATGGRVLIITLNDLVDQFIDEAEKFYGREVMLERIESRAELRRWCVKPGQGIGITNYEKMNPDDQGQVVREMRHLAGLCMDESSRLKTGGGKQKWALIKSAKGIRYKLSCTATPAPNNIMEFASQASFLERMRSENEIIWTYFTRHPETQEWEVKPYARPHFFRWMASWSIYVANPKTFGWRKGMEDVPAPVEFWHEVAETEEQRAFYEGVRAEAQRGETKSKGKSKVKRKKGDELMELDEGGDERMDLVAQIRLLEAARGFVYEPDRSVRRVRSWKPRKVAEITMEEVMTGRQVFVWVKFDAEAAIIAEELGRLGFTGFTVIDGDVPRKKRGGILQAFKRGEIPVMIGKGQMLGFGQNFQNCTATVFSGFCDSWEEHYQEVRRFYRYGQTESVRIHVVHVPLLEGHVLKNLRGKGAQFSALIREQEQAYFEAMKELKPKELAA